jgi:hypothetical protein
MRKKTTQNGSLSAKHQTGGELEIIFLTRNKKATKKGKAKEC